MVLLNAINTPLSINSDIEYKRDRKRREIFTNSYYDYSELMKANFNSQ